MFSALRISGPNSFKYLIKGQSEVQVASLLAEISNLTPSKYTARFPVPFDDLVDRIIARSPSYDV